MRLKEKWCHTSLVYQLFPVNDQCMLAEHFVVFKSLERFVELYNYDGGIPLPVAERK